MLAQIVTCTNSPKGCLLVAARLGTSRTRCRALRTTLELALLLRRIHLLLAHWRRLLVCAGCCAESALLFTALLWGLRATFEVREAHDGGCR
jgi:hypothetical protein